MGAAHEEVALDALLALEAVAAVPAAAHAVANFEALCNHTTQGLVSESATTRCAQAEDPMHAGRHVDEPDSSERTSQPQTLRTVNEHAQDQSKHADAA